MFNRSMVTTSLADTPFDYTPFAAASALAVGLVLFAAGADVASADDVNDASETAGSATIRSADTIKPDGKIQTIGEGYAFTEGPSSDGNGGFYFTDIPNTAIHHVDADGEVTRFTDQSGHANGLWVIGDGGMLACQMDGRVVRYDLATGESTVLADKYNDARFNAPNDIVPDREGGFYFTDPLYRAPKPLPQGDQSVYHVDAGGKVTRVVDALPAPNGIGMSPDGSRLYVAPSGDSKMMVYQIDAPGKLSGGRVHCVITQVGDEVGGGSDGITVDVRGNVYYTTAAGVEIVSPEGESLNIIKFPQKPANVTFAGPDKQTMVVTARTGVYTVKMPIAGL